MARELARRNQHGVETKFKFGMFGVRHQPGLGGCDDAGLLARGNGVSGVIKASPGLDLDEGQKIAPRKLPHPLVAAFDASP